METRASIRTRFHGPTNHRGARIKVTDPAPLSGQPARSIYVNWDYALNSDENHAAAAQAWLDKFIPDATVKAPGLEFDHDYYWTWTL